MIGRLDLAVLGQRGQDIDEHLGHLGLADVRAQDLVDGRLPGGRHAGGDRDAGAVFGGPRPGPDGSVGNGAGGAVGAGVATATGSGAGAGGSLLQQRKGDHCGDSHGTARYEDGAGVLGL